MIQASTISDLLFAPPIAFVFYLLLGGLLVSLGRVLAGPASPTALKTSTYASGEAPSRGRAAPGYRPFFAIALFFAIVHLGVLMLGSAVPSPVAGAYLAGLLLVLMTLILE